MAVYDAQLNNDARATTQYADLDLFFGKKTSNSDIQKVMICGYYKKELGCAGVYNSKLETYSMISNPWYN